MGGSLAEDQLWKLRCWKDCLSISTIQYLDDKCSKYPPGTCRLNYKYICADAFMRTENKLGCCNSFSVSWPESIGREDVNQRNCSKQGESELVKPTNSNSTLPTATATTTATTENGGGGPTKGSGNIPEEPKNGLSKLEIIGIVSVIVASIVTVLGFVIKRRRRQKMVEN